MINNRQQQSGRRRGRGGQRQPGGRGPESGNRIDNRARGNAPQLLEKYKTLARDAQQSGDRVLTEYYLQFADHYFRVVSESRARFEEAQAQRRPQGDFAEEQGFEGEEGFEGDEGDEFDARPQQSRSQQQPRFAREGAPRDDGRDAREGQREWRSRDEGDRPQRDDRPQQRERFADDGRRSNGQANGGGAPRDERPVRSDAPRRERDARPSDETPRDTMLSLDALPPALAPSAPPAADADGEPAPKRRGRPRKAPAPDAAAPE